MNGAVAAAWIVAGLTCLCLSLYRCFCWRPLKLSRLLRSHGLTVLPYTPIVGNTLEISRLQQAAYSCPHASGPLDHRYLSRIWAFYFAKCTDSSTSRGASAGNSFVFWLGQRPSLSVVNADQAKEILSSKWKEYVKFPTAYVAVKRIFGRSLLTVDADEWEHRRRILNPAFATDKLKAMGAQMFACVIEMIESWEQHAQHNSMSEFELDVSREFLKVSADILCRTSFGSNYKEGKAVFEDQQTIIKATYRDMARHAIFPGYRFLPTARNRLCWALQRRIDKTLRRIVENRTLGVCNHEANSYGEDLLGRILAANSSALASGSVLTTKDIIDECRTFFFAGHDTAANLLTWAAMLMAAYPDWQERARAEVLEMHGSEGHVNAHSKLKILEMILLETLRLYTPVPQLISRTKAADCSTGAQEAVDKQASMPPGVRLTILCGVVHRDKELWGDDADEFHPERFANGIARACKGMHGFMAFGFGPHICIGQTFAMLEAKLVLASVLQRFCFRLSPTYQHAPYLRATLTPQHGMPLLITSLSQQQRV
ncbi:hypothetical protein GOP47_0025947 [Adiantum capillus-veneris]|uniref:Cytochrome P450 n=1 Tax=Adiantum capillus-veneris TaxID=13818 RepID=A0A9D4U255_ADICA|nr:hypothetical protein GOP47_0025947 [Adiantum capillus-veneris]